MTLNFTYLRVTAHLCEGWWVAPGPLSEMQPWGPGRRSADWACSGDGVLSATALGKHSVGALCTAEQQCYVQTPEPGKCKCYLPGSSDKPQPGMQIKYQTNKTKNKRWERDCVIVNAKGHFSEKKISALCLINVKAETTSSSQSCFKIQQLCEYDQFLWIQCDMSFIF